MEAQSKQKPNTAKRVAVLGAVLLITGLLIFGWVISELNHEREILSEKEMLSESRLAALDKLAEGKLDIKSFYYVAPDENWNQHRLEYNKRKQWRELAASTSIVLGISGTLLISFFLITLIIRHISLMLKVRSLPAIK